MWQAWLSLDRKQLLRDPIFFMAILLPLLLMLFIAKGLPWFESVAPFSITPHIPYLLSIFLLLKFDTISLHVDN